MLWWDGSRTDSCCRHTVKRGGRSETLVGTWFRRSSDPPPSAPQDGLIDYAEFSWMLRNNNEELKGSERSKAQLSRFF
jgi:hypothetical protein